MSIAGVRALTFDVFGTVVDWRKSVIHEVTAMELRVDAAKFADVWRAGYQPAMAKVRAGALGWTNIDALHRMILDELIERHSLQTMTEPQRARLNSVWHRWAPGARRGLRSGPTSAAVQLRDAIQRERRAPDRPGTARRTDVGLRAVGQALTAARLDLKPVAVMVAAHKSDVQAARELGLKTAFVERPAEHGADSKPDNERVECMNVLKLGVAA